jgi:hypothetical protein
MSDAPSKPSTSPARGRASRRLASVAIGLSLGLALAFGGGMAWLELRLGREIRAQKHALDDRLRGVGAAVATDLQALSAAPPFEPIGASRDAGPYLNPRVGWNGTQEPIARYQAAHPGALLVVPQPLVKKLVELGDHWPEHVSDPEVAAIDTSWLAGLAGYDHWDWETDSPSALDGGIGVAAPRPEFGKLATYAKLRLMQGLAKGDAKTAAREVRQLARLLTSTELITGHSFAALLLGMERAAHDRLLAVEGAAAVEGWTPPTPDQQKLVSRVPWGIAAVLAPIAPAAEAEPVLRAPPGAFGRCAGLAEAGGIAAFSRAYFDDGTLGDRFQAIDRALKDSASSCRLRRLRDAWSAGANAKGVMRGTVDELCEGQGAFCRVLYRLPGARAKAGQLLLLMGALSPPGY